MPKVKKKVSKEVNEGGKTRKSKPPKERQSKRKLRKLARDRHREPNK